MSIANLNFIDQNGNITFEDGQPISFGNGDELTIQYTGTSSLIDSTSGDLLLWNHGNTNDTTVILGSTNDNTHFKVRSSSLGDLFVVGGSGDITVRDNIDVGGEITVGNCTSEGAVGMILVADLSQSWAAGVVTPNLVTANLQPTDVGYLFKFYSNMDATASSTSLVMDINGDTGANYGYKHFSSASTTASIESGSSTHMVLINNNTTGQRIATGTADMWIANSSSDTTVGMRISYCTEELNASATGAVFNGSARYNCGVNNLVSFRFYPSSTSHNGITFNCRIYRYA